MGTCELNKVKHTSFLCLLRKKLYTKKGDDLGGSEPGGSLLHKFLHAYLIKFIAKNLCKPVC